MERQELDVRHNTWLSSVWSTEVGTKLSGWRAAAPIVPPLSCALVGCKEVRTRAEGQVGWLERFLSGRRSLTQGA